MSTRKGRPPKLGVTRSKSFLVKLHESEFEMLSLLAAQRKCSNADVIRASIRGLYEKTHERGWVPDLVTPYPGENGER